LPLIVNHKDDINANIIDKIKEIQNSINELNMHSNVKLSKLQRHAESLFDILFVFENYPEIKNDKLSHLNISQIDSNMIEENTTDLPLNIIIYDFKKLQTLSVEINYASDLFDSDLIKDLLSLFD
ncbi:MAG: condensation domain-containing protein, partial [bacterium]